ncbi:hypothetical protein LCGC14_1115610 [marine sediment metagenome]|uniref:Uncharacterized protein n=1 Tax=marine sediment metagenome TaxID=412755 RepID=A0A0F9PNI7_9ZZZZ
MEGERPPRRKESTVAEKVQIEVPEGMTAEKLLLLVTSYEEKRVKNSARNTAKRKAVSALIKAHQVEYDKFVSAEAPK